MKTVLKPPPPPRRSAKRARSSPQSPPQSSQSKRQKTADEHSDDEQHVAITLYQGLDAQTFLTKNAIGRIKHMCKSGVLPGYVSQLLQNSSPERFGDSFLLVATTQRQGRSGILAVLFGTVADKYAAGEVYEWDYLQRKQRENETERTTGKRPSPRLLNKNAYHEVYKIGNRVAIVDLICSRWLPGFGQVMMKEFVQYAESALRARVAVLDAVVDASLRAVRSYRASGFQRAIPSQRTCPGVRMLNKHGQERNWNRMAANNYATAVSRTDASGQRYKSRYVEAMQRRAFKAWNDTQDGTLFHTRCLRPPGGEPQNVRYDHDDDATFDDVLAQARTHAYARYDTDPRAGARYHATKEARFMRHLTRRLAKYAVQRDGQRYRYIKIN